MILTTVAPPGRAGPVVLGPRRVRPCPTAEVPETTTTVEAEEVEVEAAAVVVHCRQRTRGREASTLPEHGSSCRALFFLSSPFFSSSSLAFHSINRFFFPFPFSNHLMSWPCCRFRAPPCW